MGARWFHERVSLVLWKRHLHLGRDREQIGVADRVLVAYHPWTLRQLVLGLRITLVPTTHRVNTGSLSVDSSQHPPAAPWPSPRHRVILQHGNRREKPMTDDAAWPLAQHVCRTGYGDLPASAVESARRDILDTFGCMLGGSGSPGIDDLVRVISRWGGLEESRVLLRGM